MRRGRRGTRLVFRNRFTTYQLVRPVEPPYADVHDSRRGFGSVERHGVFKRHTLAVERAVRSWDPRYFRTGG